MMFYQKETTRQKEAVVLSLFFLLYDTGIRVRRRLQAQFYLFVI